MEYQLTSSSVVGTRRAEQDSKAKDNIKSNSQDPKCKDKMTKALPSHLE